MNKDKMGKRNLMVIGIMHKNYLCSAKKLKM